MLPAFSSPEEAVGWMESLCRAFPTNPKEAEAALTELRRSEHAVEVSRIILERSEMPIAQFHALLTLQEAVLTRWDSIPPADRRALKSYLWEFICREWARLDRSVVSQGLRTFCVFWRRGWAGETDEARLSLFTRLQEGSKDGGVAALRSAKALFSLVSEFSSTRATALGLPLHFFRVTHAAFNKVGLDQSLALAMELLGDAVRAVADHEAVSDVTLLELVTTVVNVCTEVLSWEFNFVEAWQIPPTQQLIRPGPRWRSYLIRPDFLGAVFDVYHRVRLRGTGVPGGTLPHALRQLLLQLSSVHGDIFHNDDERKAYASFLVKGVAVVLSAPFYTAGVRQDGVRPGAAEAAAEEAQADEYIGLASIAVRLVANFTLSTVGQVDSFGEFARHLALLASRMLHESKALAGRQDDEGVEWRREAFALLLEAWVAMAEDSEVTSGRNPGMRNGMKDATFRIYEQYLDHELTVSRVVAEASVGQDEDDEEEEIGAADKDEQMCSAACLGRLSPARAIAAVDAQVRGVSEVLARLLETGLVDGQQALLPGGHDLSPAATGVMEQARTAVVLAAHLVADKDDGDVMVPEVLHEAFLVDTHAADLLVNLAHSLLNLLELHVELLRRGQQQTGGVGGREACSSESPLLSPYLGGALLWCLTRISGAYLFPDFALYEGGTFSFRLAQAFGSSGAQQLTLSDPPGGGGTADRAGGASDGGGSTVARALLRASWTCLCTWPSQPDVCTNALDLMGVLVTRTKARWTTSLPLWWEMVAAFGGGREAAGGAGAPGPGGAAATACGGGFRRLSVDLQGTLAQRLCEGVLNRAEAGNTAAAKEGFDKVGGAVLQRLQGLLHAVGGLNGTQRQSPRVVAESLLCIRLCRGVAVGCGSSGGSHHELGDSFVEQTYDGMTLLLTMHVSGAQSVVYEVLQYLRDIADQLLMFMSSRRSMALYEACGRAFKIYADQHAGSVRRVDPTSEEDSYDDVLCVLQLLSHLVTKDLVDQSDEPAGDKGREVKVTDVVFFGLKKVMPLMTEGLLQFPTLAAQYFSLVGFMVQTYPERLAGLESELFHQVVNSLVFGIQYPDAPVARNSLEAISVMATQHVSDSQKGGEGLSVHLKYKPDLFLGILRALLHMLVFQPSVWDRMDACATAVLPLLVCEQEGFQAFANEIVASQPEAVRPRLVEAFEKLHAGHAACGGGLEREGRRRFPAAMREFVTSCRGFLQTK